jgi:hypothetical protein
MIFLMSLWNGLKLLGRVLIEGIAGILGFILYIVIVTFPAYYYLDSGDFSTYWVLGVMFLSIFLITALLIFQEQDEESPWLVRIKHCFLSSSYWFFFAVIIVGYLMFLFGYKY